MKYKQRIVYRCKVGDLMLTEKISQDKNKDIIVDKLTHNILAYFIQLAANDCGYSESVKDLICN